MPIYEYRCQSCGTVSDVFHRRMNEPKPVCPACGEDALERLISRTNFKLKGSGWYVTDYASSDTANENASENSASASDTSASDTSANDTSASSPSSDSSSSDRGSTSSETSSASSTAASA